MASFGEGLRREREMRGVSLEEISATTKISVRLLRALEAEDFAKLPGGIFTRSFVRAYAAYLGLDEERTLAEYQGVAPRADIDLSRLTSRNIPQSEQGPFARYAQWLVVPLLLLSAYLIYRYAHRPVELPASSATGNSGRLGANAPGRDQQPTGGPATESPSGGAVSAPAGGTPNAAAPGEAAGRSAAQASASPAQSSKETGPALESSTAAVSSSPSSTRPEAMPTAGGLSLQITANEPAWVRVNADGKTIIMRTLAAEETRTITAKDSIDLITGNAQGISLALNGQVLKALGRRGEVKSAHFTSENLKNPHPQQN